MPDLISSLSFLPAGLQGQAQVGWGGEGRWGHAARSHLGAVAKPSLHVQSMLANLGSADAVEFWPWFLIHVNSPDFCTPCCVQDRWVSRAPAQSSTTVMVLFLTMPAIPLCYIRGLAISMCFHVKRCHSLAFPLWTRHVYIKICSLSEKSLAFPEIILSALLADTFVLSSCVSK